MNEPCQLEEVSGLAARFRRDTHFRHTIFLGGLLLLGLALRLHHVTAPPIDYLSWRDTQTLMVARNFYRHTLNLFTPAVDWRTTRAVLPEGTVGGTELMVVPFLTALLYHVFGIRYWVGRLVPILFALLGTAWFHRLVQRVYGSRCATISTLLLTVSPYFLYCGRCQMPEPFAYAMVFAALYYYDRWLETRTRRTFAAAVLTALLMVLGKPQIGVMIVPMAFLTFQRLGIRAFAAKPLYLFAALVGIPVAAFLYWTSCVIIPRTGLSFSGPGMFDFKRWLTDPEYYRMIAQSVFFWSVTPGVCLTALAGLGLAGRDPRRYFAHAWLLGALSLFLLMPGGTAPNGYYQLILEPPCAILAGMALSWKPGDRLRSKETYPPAAPRHLDLVRSLSLNLLLAAIAAWSLHVALQLYLPRYGADYRCGTWIRDNTPKDALVLTAAPSTTCLYFADRTGWTSWQEEYGKAATFGIDLIEKVRPLGATIVAIPGSTFDNAYFGDYNDIRDRLYDSWNAYKGQGFTVFFLTQAPNLTLPASGRLTFGVAESRKYLRGEWGPDQAEPGGVTFTTLGPALEAAIRFVSPVKPETITLNLEAWTPNLTLTTYVNGQRIGSADIPEGQRNALLPIGHIPQAGPDNTYTVTLVANRQNAESVSIALYGLTIP